MTMNDITAAYATLLASMYSRRSESLPQNHHGSDLYDNVKATAYPSVNLCLHLRYCVTSCSSDPGGCHVPEIGPRLSLFSACGCQVPMVQDHVVKVLLRKTVPLVESLKTLVFSAGISL
jgi:hypothetical protein